MGFISIRVAIFTLVRQTYRNPLPLPGLGTSYVKTTQESLPVNTGGVSLQMNYVIYFIISPRLILQICAEIFDVIFYTI